MTRLTLDTPEARRALAKCVRKLLLWADEAEDTGEEKKAAPRPGQSVSLRRLTNKLLNLDN